MTETPVISPGWRSPSARGVAMQGSKRRVICGVAAALLALAAAGCGPTQSTALIIDADVQLQAAKSADAPQLAPYEYTAAEAYLQKAREEQGYSDFEVAIDFAQKSVDYATQAKNRAMTAKAQGALPDGTTRSAVSEER